MTFINMAARRRRFGLADYTPPIITETAPATFGPYVAGDTPADAYVAGTYASTAGTISSAVAQWTINGGPALGTDVLVGADVVALSVLVTDSAANTRLFGYSTSVVPATAPDAFTVGQWALDDSPSATGNTLSVNVATLPFNGGSAITGMEYRVNGGAAAPLPGSGTGVRTITVPALASATVEIRAVNAVGNGAWSDVKELTPSAIPVVPSTITAGQWTLADSPSAGGNTLTLNITALPFNGYSDITALQFRRNGGTASTLSGLGTGARQITVLAGAASDIQVRAVNAVGNGEWSDTKTATPTVLTDGSIPFGALTKSGAGGVATTGTSITAGNASGHWQITGGFVVPSATGDTADLNAGPYTLTFNDASTMTISIIPNAYSVRTMNEAETVGELSTLALGQEVLFRAGAYNAAYSSITITRSVPVVGTWSGSNYVVFKPHAGAVCDFHHLMISGATVQNCYFEFTGFRFVAAGGAATTGCIRLLSSASYIYIHDNTSNTTDPGPTGMDTLSSYVYCAENNGAGHLRIENNVWTNGYHGIVPAGNDLVIKGNTFRNAYADFMKVVPPCSRMQVIGNICTDKQASYTPYTITAITRGATTLVTVTDATGVSPGDDVYFVNLTGCEGLIGRVYNINSIAGNVLTVGANSTSFTDWVSGGTARITGVHGDFLQVIASTAADGELDDFIIRGNQFTRGAGTSGDVDGQGIFLADSGDGVYYRNALIEGNIIDTTMTNGITINNPEGCTVRNNVAVRKLGHSGLSGTTAIRFTGVGTGNACLDNVSNAYDFTATVETRLNNLTLTQNDSAAYAAAFDAPPSGETAAVASVAYAPKAGGPLAIASPVQGAVPYQSFVDPWTYLNPREEPVIIAIFGQSQPEYLLNSGPNYRKITQPTVTTENVRVITRSGAGAALGPIVDRLVTASAVSAGQVNPWVANLSVWLNTVRPGREVIIVDLCEEGTGRNALMNDANPDRNWSDLVATVDYVRATYGEIQHIVECWMGNDGPEAKAHCLEWAPFYSGQRFGGGAFTLGTANPDSTGNVGVTVDHCLWDAAADGTTFGRGLFKRSETKLHLVGWPTFNSEDGTEANNFSASSGYPTQIDRPAKDQYLAFHEWAVSLGFGGNFGPSSHVAEMAAGTHPDENVSDGQILMGWAYAISIANILGASITEPVISSASYAFDGTYAEFTVTGPAGGYLTTLRAFRGSAGPTVEPPHYQPVMGFEIRRLGDAESARRPVWKLSETGRGANYRGTVTIVGNKIRVTPEVPFTNGDIIEFLRGDGSATLQEPRDTDAQLWKNFPIWHTPSLYDAGALYPLQGIPVRPQPPAFTVSLVAISEMTNTVTSNLATWDGDPVDTNVVASDLAEWN